MGIRREHPFKCMCCGHHFTTQLQWKHHMRDKHMLNEQDAIRDDRKSKVERWLCAAKVAPQQACAELASSKVSGASMVTDFALHCHHCELCGAEALLPVDLTGQGLSFSCSYLGGFCKVSSIRSPAPAVTVAIAPTPVGLAVAGQGPNIGGIVAPASIPGAFAPR